MKIFSKKALKEAQDLAKIATDEYEMAIANMLLMIAYGHHKFDPLSESSMRLAEKYYED